MWISMPLSLVSLENGTLSTVEISRAYSSFQGLYFTSDPSLRTAYLESFDLYFKISDQQISTEAPFFSTYLNLTQDVVNFCGDEYILIPVDIYTQSEVIAIGSFRFYVRFYFDINGENFYPYTYVWVDVDPGKYMLFALLILVYYNYYQEFFVQMHIIPFLNYLYINKLRQKISIFIYCQCALNFILGPDCFSALVMFPGVK